MSDTLLDSERIAIARHAHTGRWITKRLRQSVIATAKAEREKHKRGERCMGCEMMTLEIGFTAGKEGWEI